MDDKLACEERESREEAVDEKEDGGEGVNADVQVRNTLQEFHARGCEDGIVPGEENFDGTSRPPKHLQSVKQRITERSDMSSYEVLSAALSRGFQAT